MNYQVIAFFFFCALAFAEKSQLYGDAYFKQGDKKAISAPRFSLNLDLSPCDR